MICSAHIVENGFDFSALRHRMYSYLVLISGYISGNSVASICYACECYQSVVNRSYYSRNIGLSQFWKGFQL